MINYDRIADVDHDKVRKLEICDFQGGRGGGPCLDPNTIICVGEGAILDVDALDILLRNTLAKAANADAMAGPARDALDMHLRQLIAHGDAVVSSLDAGVMDLDVGATGNVEAVGVRAVPRGNNLEFVEGDIVARYAVGVEVLAVFGGDAFDNRVVDEIEAEVYGELHAVLVLVTIVLGPGNLAHAVKDAGTGEFKEVDVVDGDPFTLFVGELVWV